ncbi:Putative protein serine/threonine phosphatase [Herminiimonas arsenicoxydans]|uniref:PPM-type phosphatase domain-containing protein n=1 Tax=Herminiimonas arsenicoxydans TaxID=204773 RepID=A4G8A6_HERAR|nr:Putative protein serine/threonine phosphatase [Herminiimonas arsenicoxydans]
MTHHVALQFAVKTDTGLVRAHNEDAVEINLEHKIAVLADGMGGYNAGEVASGIATSVFMATLEQRLQQKRRGRLTGKFLQGLMVEAATLANAQILEAARIQPQFSGMGTTLVAALFHHERIVLAHIGDSRAYRFRRGSLQQLTRDHSQLQEQIDAGLVSPEWARFAPNKNLITRALGVAPQIDVEVNDYPTENDDIYLLCSDGLSDMLSHEQMIDILKSNYSDLDLSCRTLVEAANNNGGRDNISVILAKVESSWVAPTSLRVRFLAWLRSALPSP